MKSNADIERTLYEHTDEKQFFESTVDSKESEKRWANVMDGKPMPHLPMLYDFKPEIDSVSRTLSIIAVVLSLIALIAQLMK